ncbi:hypothetical protein ACFYRK_20175 [Streptomyces sp. NPDC005381]|uniref:hypothetical protein n=1 Tax=Streptomyces sp. NPDC005381 TaxID=3364714 RepID=UPI0036B701EE
MSEYIRRAHGALSEVAAEGASSVATYADGRVTEILGVHSASRIVREILDDDRALAETAARSYTHSNGFDKITLLSSREPEFKLRLHVWWPDGRNGWNGEFVHSHRWLFRSTTLCGSAHVETFTVRDGGQPVYRHEYQPRDDHLERYGLKVVGRSSLVSDMMFTLTSGSTYAMGPNLLHRVTRANDAVSITMFVRWATTHPTASVFAESPILDEGILSVPSFTRDQLRSKLQDVVAALGQR